MRALWRGRGARSYLSDALTVLSGWSQDGRQITRVLHLDDAQHAALTERIKVVADALHLRPQIRRADGLTHIKLGSNNEDGITENDVTLAARIEDAYRAVLGTR
ncbi:MAG TPA: 4a-hydroxytetrahydrobiopterin dehydratase [Micromonosporaceae bacterium]